MPRILRGLVHGAATGDWGFTQAAASMSAGDGVGERVQRPGLQQRKQIGWRTVEDAIDTGEPAIRQRDTGRAV